MRLYWIDCRDTAKIRPETLFRLQDLTHQMKNRRGINLENLYHPDVTEWSYAIAMALIKTTPAETYGKRSLKMAFYVPIKMFKKNRGHGAPVQIPGECERYDGFKSNLYMGSLQSTPGGHVPRDTVFRRHGPPTDVRTTILCAGWVGKEDDLFLSRDPERPWEISISMSRTGDRRLIFLAVLNCEWFIIRPKWWPQEWRDDPRRSSGRSVIKRLLKGITWVFNPFGIGEKIPRAYISKVIKEEKKRVCERDLADTVEDGLTIYPQPETKADFDRLDEHDRRDYARFMERGNMKWCEWCGRRFVAKRSDARACPRSACKKALSQKSPVRKYRKS